jgi:hypothetical protein
MSDSKFVMVNKQFRKGTFGGGGGQLPSEGESMSDTKIVSLGSLIMNFKCHFVLSNLKFVFIIMQLRRQHLSI